MKQVLKSTVAIFAIVLVGVYGFLWLMVHPKPTVVQELPSPDGQYVAYVYESNGGATTGFLYHLSILKKGEKLRRGDGNSFIQEDDPFSVTWLSDRVLWVENASTFHRQRTEVKGVEIQYRYTSLEKE